MLDTYLKATTDITFAASLGALLVKMSSSGNVVFSMVKRSARTLYAANMAPCAVYEQEAQSGSKTFQQTLLITQA